MQQVKAGWVIYRKITYLKNSQHWLVKYDICGALGFFAKNIMYFRLQKLNIKLGNSGSSVL